MGHKDLILEHVNKSESKLKSARIEFDNELYEESISAAYYAMYHSAKAVLLTKDISPKTHKGVISELGKEFIESFESGSIASVSWGLERRIKADYDVLFEPDKSEAIEAISKAEKFVSEAKKLLGV
jgi:uncharacterized protein